MSFYLPISSIAQATASNITAAQALAKKKALAAAAVRRLQGLGQDYTSFQLSSAAGSLAEADEARSRLAALQMEPGTAAGDGGGAPGFFNSKTLLLAGAAVAVLLLLRR